MLGIDDIHNPHRQVKEAEELAAAAFGARATKFLVNGSTVGNQAMLTATLGPADLVLAPRSVHRSFFSGLLLSGARVELFATDVHPELGCHLPPTAEQVKAAIESFPEARALFLTSPIYQGACAPLIEIVALAKERGLIVLVDEAWGAHLHFSPQLPDSAVDAGADMVVHSLHKSAGGLTPSAVLHFDPGRVNRGRLETVLRHLQTSSPSSLLVASIDCARRQLALSGEADWGRAAGLAARAQVEVGALDGFSCFEKRSPDWDPTKVSIEATAHGYTGHDLARTLRWEHKVQVEMSEASHLLLAFSPGHTESHLDKLLHALSSLPPGPGLPACFQRESPPIPIVSPKVTVRQAFHARSKMLDLRKAVDQTCAELLYCYPPGVPVVFPGQPLTVEVVEFIETQLALGGCVLGGVDPDLETVLVLEERE